MAQARIRSSAAMDAMCSAALAALRRSGGGGGGGGVSGPARAGAGGELGAGKLGGLSTRDLIEVGDACV